VLGDAPGLYLTLTRLSIGKFGSQLGSRARVARPSRYEASAAKPDATRDPRSGANLARAARHQLHGQDHALGLSLLAIDAVKGELGAQLADSIRVGADHGDTQQIGELEVVETDEGDALALAVQSVQDSDGAAE
jgi:hypothetical protein